MRFKLEKNIVKFNRQFEASKGNHQEYNLNPGLSTDNLSTEATLTHRGSRSMTEDYNMTGGLQPSTQALSNWRLCNWLSKCVNLFPCLSYHWSNCLTAARSYTSTAALVLPILWAWISHCLICCYNWVVMLLHCFICAMLLCCLLRTSTCSAPQNNIHTEYF